jgi:AraC family ethanolamine operon transcriptional activator
VEQPNLQQLILQDFLPLLIAALPLQQEKLKRPVKLGARSRLVKQAATYMQDHLNQPLTLSDLCNALSTSSRTLSYGYDDVFGMSPMAYLKTVRLQGVHRALKQANPQTTSITQLANQFGFWSLNHFAKDYKVMFGETPWRTLTR